MTRNDDIERVLQQWFTEGPRHMSDRVFDGTFERIERLPRRRFADFLERLPAMHLNLRLAVGAAVLVALVGTGLIVMHGLPSVGTQPSPSPTSDPAVTGAALQSWWSAVGDRLSPGDWGPTDNTFEIDATGLGIEQVHGNVLSSWYLIDGGSRLVVRWEREVIGSVPSYERWGCQIGDEGIYAVRLGDGGATLTLGLISDPCAPRAVFLPGAWARCAGGSSCVVDVPSRPSPDANAASSAAPDPTTGSTMLPSAVAVALQGGWTSIGLRPMPGLPDATTDGAPGGVVEFFIDPTSILVNQFKGDVSNAWTIDAEMGGLQVRTESPRGPNGGLWEDCPIGDEGSYKVGLSPDRALLTLTVGHDACASRSAVMNGQWTRWPCAGVPFRAPCRTELAVGQHVVAKVQPFGGGTSGQLAYEVPAGWGMDYIPPTWDELSQRQHLALLRLSAPDSDAIKVYSSVYASSPVQTSGKPAPACRESGIGIAQTPSAVATWLATIPGLVVGTPAPITVGGLDGAMVDVSLVPGWTIQCGSFSYEGETPPTAPIYDDEPLRTFAELEGGDMVTVTDGNRARYMLLDGGDEHPLLIVIEATDASWDDMLAAAMPVIESMEFTR